MSNEVEIRLRASEHKGWILEVVLPFKNRFGKHAYDLIGILDDIGGSIEEDEAIGIAKTVASLFVNAKATYGTQTYKWREL